MVLLVCVSFDLFGMAILLTFLVSICMYKNETKPKKQIQKRMAKTLHWV